MIRETIRPETARTIYDRIGAKYDWLEFYEGRAKARARDRLDLRAGQDLLDAGCGTGKEHRELEAAVAPGMTIALDLSWVMASITAQRTSGRVCQADVTRMPFKNECFDRILSSYVLDLLSDQQLEAVLAEFWRLLRPGGRLVLVSLTYGVTTTSRVVVTLWEAVYQIAPVACAGCRPLRLSELVQDWPYRNTASETVVQFGIPSEILIADK